MLTMSWLTDMQVIRYDQVETIFHKADAQLLKALEKLHHPILAETLAILIIFDICRKVFISVLGLVNIGPSTFDTGFG